MSQAQQPGTEVAETGQMPGELVRQFSQMAMIIPGGEEDPIESILAQILNSDSWKDLDQPWNAESGSTLVGVTFRIDSLIRRPSQFRDALGIFLVVQGVREDSGEKITFTTSAIAVVAQLVRAYCAGWLPLWATMVVADRPTESGYYPHHLHFYGPAAPREIVV